MQILSVILIALVFPAQDAATLLKQRTEALEKYQSYEYTEEMAGDGIPPMINHVQHLKPAKMRMESKMGEMTVLTFVSDGKQVWMYSPMMKTYSKIPVDSGDAQDLVRDALGTEDDEASLEANARVVRTEALDVGGETRNCWVVESRVADSLYTIWIDISTGIDLQRTTSGKVNLRMSKRSLKLDESMPDALFVFSPPADAKETAELFPITKTPVREPKAPSSAPSTNEPQAYIPDLNPLLRVEPVYPDAARGKDLGGMVHLLLTIDTAGRVTHVEPLTGRDILRPAAVDAVMQWTFHPVMRNGKPVDAYTDGMVFFFDAGGKPGTTPEDMGMNISEEMAAAQRLAELTRKYSRTPEQVLADAEQQGDSSSPEYHGVELSKLAKVALEAGALDKARNYANELLRSATDPKAWDYGDAIHDGNMVLGLVALREGNVPQAKLSLIESARTSGSPRLDSFGPDLTLARELAKQGERDAVLEYFSLCRAFWKLGSSQLDSMTAAVRSGRPF